MRAGWTRVLIGVVAGALLSPRSGGATTFVSMSESDVARRSVAAVIGWVTDIEAAPDLGSGGVNTYVHIEREQTVFGFLPPGEVVLREVGGRLGDRSEWIFGSPEYRVGEEVLVFLSPNADGSLHTTALAMGKFTIETDARGGRTAVRHLGEGAAVWDLRQGRSVEPPEAEEYDFAILLGAVREAVQADPRLASHRAAVRLSPRELTQATLTEHREAFTYLSAPSRWFEPDDGVSIPYAIDAAGDVGLGPTPSRAAIDDAFAAWTNLPTSSVALADGGVLAGPISYAGCTGGNRVVFNDPFDEIADPWDCGGVLAVAGYCASSETRTVNGRLFRRIRVGKIMFNNGWASCPGWDRCNLSEVATHELGHTLGFGHSPDTSATMYASAHFDGRCASLRTDDINGANFVYPAATATPTNTRTATAPSATPTRTDTPAPTRTATATVPCHGVRGRVRYYVADRPVPDVTVNLSGAVLDAAQTSAAGDYEFAAVPEGSWELAAAKSDDFGSGISALDAAYVLQAVAGLRTLDETQRLACDATGNGQLSALDAVRILQFSAGILDRLPVATACGSDWLFIPDPAPMPQQRVIDPAIAGDSCSPGKIMLDALLDEASDQNFRALLFGDCTGNWRATDGAAAVRGSAAARQSTCADRAADRAPMHEPTAR